MAKIALSGPADLLATIPYHLGFYPRRSVVVVCFHDNRLGLVARLDAVAGRQVARCVESLLPVLRREAPTSVTLASFEAHPGETLPLHQALADGVDAAGITLREQLLVRDRRWYSLDCTRSCCPPEGLPMPHDADVPAVAAFVGLGQAVLADRKTMAGLVAPLPSDDPGHHTTTSEIERWQHAYSWSWFADPETAVAPVEGTPSTAPREDAGQCEEQRRELLVDEALTCWRELLHDEPRRGGVLTTVPQLVAPLRFTELRDGIIAWLCPGALPLGEVGPGLRDQLQARLGPVVRGVPRGGGDDDGSRHAAGSAPGPLLGDWEAAAESRSVQTRLARLCRETPTAHAAPVLSVLACYAWWTGDGALAGMAVDQALEIEPDHRLCGLVRSALDHGLRAMGTAA